MNRLERTPTLSRPLTLASKDGAAGEEPVANDPLQDSRARETETERWRREGMEERSGTGWERRSAREGSIEKVHLEAQSIGLSSDSVGWKMVEWIANQQPSVNQGSIHGLLSRIAGTGPGTGTGTEPYPRDLDLLLLLPTQTQPIPTRPATAFNSQPVLSNNLHQLALAHLLVISNHPPLRTRHFVSLAGHTGFIDHQDRIIFTCLVIPPNLINLTHSSLLSPINPPASLDSLLSSPPNLCFPLYFPTKPAHDKLSIPRLNPINSSRSTALKLASLFASRSDADPISLSVRLLDAPLDPVLLDHAITTAIQNRICDALGSLEEPMLQRISSFVASLAANPPHPSQAPSTLPASLHLASTDQISHALQELYLSFDNELELEYRNELSDRETESETRMIIDHTLELIEEVVCVELYERLFEQSAQDNELSEKIARLNLADVSLDHLGLDLDRREMDDPQVISTIRSGLEEIISAASAELARLQDSDCRSPRDKVAVCVTVHKLIVDGLSSLPPIPMKKGGIPASTLGGGPVSQDQAEVEMSNTLDRAGLPAGTNHPLVDRTLPTPSPLRRSDPQQPSQSDLLDAIETDLIEPPVPLTLPSTPDQAMPPPARPNSSSADLILPILIYLIIRANPSGLLSNLNYVNLFRYRRLIKGETDYCLVNFNVSCEFIKSFDGLFGLDSGGGSLRGSSKREGTQDGSVGRKAGSRPGYGTFPGSRARQKSGNEVEEALMTASRAVSGMLLGGYQKMISGGLLDASTARLPSGPRTLEDVKKLIGSGSGGRREGGLSGWSNRVGLSRQSTSSSKQSQSQLQETHQPVGLGLEGASGSAVRRLSSLFNTNSGNLGGAAQRQTPLQDEDLRMSIGHRLSSLAGLGRLGVQSSGGNTPTKDTVSSPSTPTPGCSVGTHERVKSGQHDMSSPEGFNFGGGESIGTGSTPGLAKAKGPIEKFEKCPNSNGLVIGDITLLLADYQRLSKLGRQAGIW